MRAGNDADGTGRRATDVIPASSTARTACAVSARRAAAVVRQRLVVDQAIGRVWLQPSRVLKQNVLPSMVAAEIAIVRNDGLLRTDPRVVAELCLRLPLRQLVVKQLEEREGRSARVAEAARAVGRSSSIRTSFSASCQNSPSASGSSGGAASTRTGGGRGDFMLFRSRAQRVDNVTFAPTTDSRVQRGSVQSRTTPGHTNCRAYTH